MIRVLLLSAYDADSHQQWHQQLQAAFNDYQWTVLTLPARYFSWRIRGNSLSWAFGQRDVLEREYDLLIATSMVDLSALRGFVPSLAAIPTLLYFHENQFAYPGTAQQFSSLEPQVLNLYSALAADKVLFNSDYNRDSFLQGVATLLAKMPDQVPAGIVAALTERSEVLAVPLSQHCFQASRADSTTPLQVLWNHRWEYDKAPERLLSALQKVFEQPVAIELHIVGQQFRQQPPAFGQIKSFFDQHHPGALKHWGYVEDVTVYRDLLTRCDVVVSTALHDFQGLAVMEAVAAGCVPLLPDRLCYGQWFEPGYRYVSCIDQPEQEADALAVALLQLAEAKLQGALPVAPDLSGLAIDAMKSDYQAVFDKLLQ